MKAESKDEEMGSTNGGESSESEEMEDVVEEEVVEKAPTAR